MSFQNSGCSKSPTTSAFSLILNSGNGSLSNPINSSKVFVQVKGHSRLLSLFLFVYLQSKVSLSKLFICQIEELCFSEDLSAFLLVVFLSVEHILCVNGKSICFFSWSISLIVLLFEELEGICSFFSVETWIQE